MNPEDLLDEARRACDGRRPDLQTKIWRWARNRCKECGAKRIMYSTDLGDTKICSVNPKKHKDYVWDASLTAVLAMTTFILLVMLIMASCGSRIVIVNRDHHRIPDGYMTEP